MRYFHPARFALLALLVLPGNALAATLSVLEIQPTSGIVAGTPVTFYAAADGFRDPTFSVSNSFGSAGTIDKFGYFSWTPTIDDAGTHIFTVTVKDSFGNNASTTARIYVIPKSLAIQQLSPGTIVYTNAPVAFTVHAPGFTSPWFTLSDSYAGTSVTNANLASTGIFSWTPASNEQGLHTLTITARDLYGLYATITQDLTVMPPTVAFGKPSTRATVGTPVTFTATSVGLTKPSYTITDSLGFNSTLRENAIASTTGAFSWTPAARDIGTHTLTLTATDANRSTATAKLTLTVEATSSAATSTSTPAQTTAPASTPASASSSTQNSYIFTSFLGIGSRSTAVTELQKHLTADGSYAGPVTGYFGALTAAGVKKFQAAHGIEPVGYVGPQTRAALNTP